jgi:mRNA-degrading endonuclease RelE of RelBE toxin-antitoxin system
MYKVNIKKSVLKNIHKLPKDIQFTLDTLVDDLMEKGPETPPKKWTRS